ncbi:MAG: nuclear transport factor 2 family protein [Acidimicrobiales bacterium]
MDEHRAEDLADLTRRIADERACERLIARYTHLVDFGDAPAIADLFTADGVWRTDEFAMNGRDEIRAGFGRRQGVLRRQSRHVCTNVVIDVDGDEAKGLCYLVNYRHDSETGTAEKPAPADVPKYVGEYHDRFVRTPDGWRFADRHCDMAFVRPPKHEPTPAHRD